MTTLAPVGRSENGVTVVVLSSHNLRPDRIEVHVGDIVTWRSARGEPIELRFDLHPRAHEVTARSGVVHSFFRTPGEHAYWGRIKDGRRFRGLVVVGGRDAASAPPSAECDPSKTLCILP